MMNRRDFVALLTAASATMKATPLLADPLAASQGSSASPEDDVSRVGPGTQTGFPIGDYTPFGYLDNPWHTWDLHLSGVFRSLPGIGFGLYYPAGPGGYFDYHANGIYAAELALGFRIGQHILYAPEDFRSGQLASPYHSKNILSYVFEESGVIVTSSYLQVDEDALAVHIELVETSGREQSAQIAAFHTCRLGGRDWWGRDGLSGGFDKNAGTLWIRSFAAGPVFAIAGSRPSDKQFFSSKDEDRGTWLGAAPQSGVDLAYYPQPLHGGLLYKLELAPHSRQEVTVMMARASNLTQALKHSMTSLPKTAAALARKRSEDATFWNAAPKLAGDWPEHWQRGWVYDFETLRTMVRRPIGVYKHPWDAMQIQAPRNVLAETSIDMWALSYADPEMAQQVFLGQFLDALDDNIPCMREDGVMNMVAADGSECGTSISWCFPFFCAASIFDRTRDLAWLGQLYPRLSALLRWTLAHRSDSGGFLVGKCSWETGMDTSKRFQIQQPTGGELVDFLRLVELQAAASQAGAILARFAKLTADTKSIPEWRSLQRTYAEKTQQLWKDDWFHDFDTRAGQLVTAATRDPSQAAPAFCGVSTDDQKKRLLPTLRKMYDELLAQEDKDVPQGDFSLNWSSFVLPYLEAAWSGGNAELTSQTVETICNRIYTSMDRRSVEGPVGPKGVRRKLGWPGTSCEIWGGSGAFGGEVYGWGAVMPAHIIRNLIGFRETEDAGRIVLAPSFPPSLAATGKQYGITGLPYAKQRLNLRFTFLDDRHLRAEAEWPAGIQSIASTDGHPLPIDHSDGRWSFNAVNHERYTLRLP
jgi:hypothetical protein